MGRVGIFDATNSCRDRREWLIQVARPAPPRPAPRRCDIWGGCDAPTDRRPRGARFPPRSEIEVMRHVRNSRTRCRTADPCGTDLPQELTPILQSKSHIIFVESVCPWSHCRAPWAAPRGPATRAGRGGDWTQRGDAPWGWWKREGSAAARGGG
jgi:hypothetical protein